MSGPTNLIRRARSNKTFPGGRQAAYLDLVKRDTSACPSKNELKTHESAVASLKKIFLCRNSPFSLCDIEHQSYVKITAIWFPK